WRGNGNGRHHRYWFRDGYRRDGRCPGCSGKGAEGGATEPPGDCDHYQDFRPGYAAYGLEQFPDGAQESERYQAVRESFRQVVQYRSADRYGWQNRAVGHLQRQGRTVGY